MRLNGFDDWDDCQGYLLQTNADDWLQGAKCGGQSGNVHPLQTCFDNDFSMKRRVTHTGLVSCMFVLIRNGWRSASFILKSCGFLCPN